MVAGMTPTRTYRIAQSQRRESCRDWIPVDEACSQEEEKANGNCISPAQDPASAFGNLALMLREQCDWITASGMTIRVKLQQPLEAGRG